MRVDQYYMSVAFLVSYCVQLGSSLKCYTCETTQHGVECDRDDIGRNDDMLVECELDQNNKQQNKCFKTVSTIRDAKMDTTFTITGRGCVHSTKNSCDSATTPAGGRYVECYCDRNECNAHAPLSISAWLLVASGLVTMWLWKQEQ